MPTVFGTVPKATRRLDVLGWRVCYKGRTRQLSVNSVNSEYSVYAEIAGDKLDGREFESGWCG